MSQSQRHQTQETASEASSSPYATDRDWWYDDDAKVNEPTKGDGHAELPGKTRSDYVAHKILKRGADLICPIALNEEPVEDDFHTEGERIPVTEAKEVVPKRHDGGTVAEQDYGAHDNEWRVNEEYGYLVSGPVIADRARDEFLMHVNGVLDAVEVFCDRSLPERERDAIAELAEEMKRDGAHDVSIMAEVVRCIDNNGRALDD